MTARVRAVGLAVAAVLLTGCGFRGVYSLPLPGAVANGGNTYSVKVQLADVLDLVPYSAVKVNGATVGHVSDIRLEGRHALVTCRLLDTVRLPANAVARVEQTSVLGEKFVELEPPATAPAAARLANGAVIPLARTDTDASVEEVLAALSMLLNGGGVAQLRTITQELGTALHGRTGVSRALLSDLDTFAAGLDAQKHAIVQALDGIDRLASTVRRQESSLTGALDTLPGALGVLADDRKQLTAMLTAVGRLGDVAGTVVEATHADLVANLKALEPTLDKLASVGETIPQILSTVLMYPTADSVEKEYFGDYGNLSMTIDVSSASLANTFGGKLPVPTTGSSPPATHFVPGGGGIGGLLGGLP